MFVPKLKKGTRKMTSTVNRALTRTDMAAVTPRTLGDTIILVEAGREGVFVWDPADRSVKVAADTAQGVYVAPSSATTGASGAWVRSFEERLQAEWFGMKADGTTDNSNAMDALLAFLAANKSDNGTAPYPAVYKVQFALGKYYFSRIVHLKIPVVFEGIIPIGSASRATELDFLTGGFVCHRVDTAAKATSGAHLAEDASSTTGADGSTFRNLYCSSRQTRPTSNYLEQSTDGLLAFCMVQVENCVFDGFTRDGVSIQTSDLTPNHASGNADMSHLEGVHSYFNGRHGIHLDGVDSNQITCRRCNVRYNNNWGIYDSGFLSNQHYDHHAAYNGMPAGNIWSESKGDGNTSVVRYLPTQGVNNGTDYYVSPGKAGVAGTTLPGSDNTVWTKQLEGAGTGAPDGEGAMPTWGPNGLPANMNIKEGGSYFINSITPTVAVNLYCELSQGQPYSGALPVCFLAGDLEGNPNSLGTFIMPIQNALTARFGRGFQSRYLNPANNKVTSTIFGSGLESGIFYQLFDDDYFPSQGWHARLVGGNVSFGYNHAAVPGISFAVSGPSGGFGCPNTVRKDVTWIPRLALGANTRRVLDVDTAEPTSGSWDVGSIVFNATPSAGGKAGWICTAAGSPGTWKAFGAIDA